MIELAPLSPAWREAIRNNLREFIGYAIKACPDQADKLDEAKRAGFELTSIMSGNPDSGSFRLRQLVDQLDRAAAHFEQVASELEADSPMQALHLGQAARVISDAAMWVHCPEQSQPGGWVQSHGGDLGKPLVTGVHTFNTVLQAGDELARADSLLAVDNASGSNLAARQAEDRRQAYGKFKIAAEQAAPLLPVELAEQLLAYSHIASGIVGPVDPKAWPALRAKLKMAAEASTAGQQVDGAQGGGMAGVKNAKQVRPKQSTVNGEAQAKLVAALIAHHDYGNGSVLKWEPIGNNELARKAKVAPGSATAFFKEHFGDGGHANYRRACSNNDGRLAIVLGKVSGDLNTAKLFELRDSDGATDTDDADE